MGEYEPSPGYWERTLRNIAFDVRVERLRRKEISRTMVRISCSFRLTDCRISVERDVRHELTGLSYGAREALAVEDGCRRICERIYRDIGKGK